MPLTITATLSGGASQSDTSRTAYIPPYNQTFGYDLNGNLTSDGLWTYNYDAENRLVSATSVAITGFPNQLIDFQYDYLGRRIQKKVANYNGSTYVFSYARRYLYDGNNLVAEFDSDGSSCGTLHRSYAWGLDVAGSLSATGGVGALVQITDHTTHAEYLPTYNANGNVASLVNAADGSTAAVYEYTPFGELLRCEGGYAKQNPMRFSTKYTDDETGLVYYGARYYSPSLGRFVNRDPIEEAGGLNLYGFCGNDGIDRWDVNGDWSLRKWWDHTFLSAGKHIAQNWDHGRQYVMMAAAVVAGVLTAGAALEAYAALEGSAFVGGFWGAVTSVSLAGGWGCGWAVAAGAGFGFGSSFSAALISGQSFGGALRAGVIGGIAGGVGTFAAQALANAEYASGDSDYFRHSLFQQDTVYGATKGLVGSGIEALGTGGSIGKDMARGALNGASIGMLKGLYSTFDANAAYADQFGSKSSMVKLALDIKPLGAVVGAAVGGLAAYAISDGNIEWAAGGAVAGGLYGWMSSGVTADFPNNIHLSTTVNVGLANDFSRFTLGGLGVNASLDKALIELTGHADFLGMRFSRDIALSLGGAGAGSLDLPPSGIIALTASGLENRLGPIHIPFRPELNDWVLGAKAYGYQ